MVRNAAIVKVGGSARTGYKVTVDPPLIPVHRALGDVTIIWAIRPSDYDKGWRFKRKGVVIDQRGLRQFSQGVTADKAGSRFTWKNRNSVKARFRYMVFLVNRETGAEADSDPAIQNQADS